MTYRHVAEHFKISKARVSQIIALVEKLPDEIIDYLSNEDSSERTCYFTERKLRPLTLMVSNEEKIKRFEQMKSSSKKIKDN